MTEIQAELVRLAGANEGVLKPEVVVEAARDAASPLHSSFTWDDTEAAHAYRLWQARKLIVTVRVEYTGGPQPVELQRFVSLSTDRPDGGYREIIQVMRREDTRDQLLADACAEMERFQRKYAMLEALADVFVAMRRVPRRQAAHAQR